MNLYLDNKKKDIFKIVGANVRYYRQLYNLNHPKEMISQAKLAEIIGVSTGLIGAIEAERLQGVSAPVLWNISQVLGVPINKFFEEQKELVSVK